jgi:phage tail tube protein FII
MIEIAGTAVLELDKLNSVFKVNGVDLLADVRSMC